MHYRLATADQPFPGEHTAGPDFPKFTDDFPVHQESLLPDITQISAVTLSATAASTTGQTTAYATFAYTYIIPMFCMFGMLVNMLNVAVLRKLKASTYAYLTGLAVADGSALAVVSTSFVIRCSNCYSPPQCYGLRLYEAFFWIPFANYFITVSNWLIVILAVERFAFVKYPFTTKVKSTPQLAKKIIAITFLVAVIPNIHWVTAFNVERDDANLELSSFAATTAYHVIVFISMLTMIFIPIAILICLNALLVFFYNRSSAKLANTGTSATDDGEAVVRHHQRQRKLTSMMIIIITVFLLGNVPSMFAAHGITSTIIPDYSVRQAYTLVANSIQLLALAANFIVYFLCNEKFKTVLLQEIFDHTNRIVSRNSSKYRSSSTFSNLSLTVA